MVHRAAQGWKFSTATNLVAIEAGIGWGTRKKVSIMTACSVSPLLTQQWLDNYSGHMLHW